MNAPNRWRKSTHSGGDEGNCVEIAKVDGYIGIRDSKAPHNGYLALTRQSFAALLTDLTSKP